MNDVIVTHTGLVTHIHLFWLEADTAHAWHAPDRLEYLPVMARLKNVHVY